MKGSPILLIGGTRGTGLLIARRLLDDGVAIRVLARDPARAIRELGPASDVVRGDITAASTLAPAIAGCRHIIFTAGCRSGRPVREAEVRRTEYGGIINTLTAASRVGFTGRFLYMNSSGIGRRSFWALALNLYKGNTLVWRERAEVAIRASGLPYSIVRTGVLMNGAGGRHAIQLTQQALPLSPRYRIARADVAAAFVVALDHPRTIGATFEIAWANAKGGEARRWSALFDGLRPDDHSRSN
jgi:nucleoside-diphosphate-sugar epimerase